MTIGTSVGRELDVTTIVRRAYQLAGLMPAEQGTTGPTWSSKAALGRDLLESIIDELSTEGVFARARSMQTVTLTAGTKTYTLPGTVFDVIENGAYIRAGDSVTAASAELPVIQKDIETWQALGTKAASGPPTLFYVDRSVFPIQVTLWPTPDDAGTIRFQMHRLLSDVSDGNATVDLERYWTQYLLWELAHQLASASSQPDSKCGRLHGTAMEYRQRAKAASNQHVPSLIYLDHATNWSGR